MASGSGHELTGVSARKNGKFKAYISHKGKQVHLGQSHATREEAAHAHDRCGEVLVGAAGAADVRTAAPTLSLVLPPLAAGAPTSLAALSTTSTCPSA